MKKKQQLIKYLNSGFYRYDAETLKKIKDKEIFKIFMQQKIHFGHHKQNIKKEFKACLHSFFNDYGIINLKITLTQLRIVMNIMLNLGIKNGNLLIIDSPVLDKKIFEPRIPFEGIYCLSKSEWIPGLLSNKTYIQKAMKASFSNPNTKQEKIDLYEKLLYTIKRVDVLLVVDPLSCVDIINEAFATNTPVISFVDLNCFVKKIDYPIICNNQSTDSIFFLLQLLLKAYKKGIQYQKFDTSNKEILKTKKKKMKTVSYQKTSFENQKKKKLYKK